MHKYSELLLLGTYFQSNPIKRLTNNSGQQTLLYYQTTPDGIKVGVGYAKRQWLIIVLRVTKMRDMSHNTNKTCGKLHWEV